MSQKKKKQKQHRKEVRKLRAEKQVDQLAIHKQIDDMLETDSKQVSTTENPTAKKPVVPYKTKKQ